MALLVASKRKIIATEPIKSSTGNLNRWPNILSSVVNKIPLR